MFQPGGSLFITTLNKTLPMWLGGIVLGEYVLNLAPPGTHHWDKLITPLEVQRILDTCTLLNQKKQIFISFHFSFIQIHFLFVFQCTAKQ